jgi:hypothetical protein
VRFNEREVLISNIVGQSWYDTPIFSATVSMKIIMAPPTGTQHLISCSSFSGITVFGGPKPLFRRFSTEHVFYQVGLYLHVQAPNLEDQSTLYVSSPLTCPACDTLPLATIPPV